MQRTVLKYLSHFKVESAKVSNLFNVNVIPTSSPPLHLSPVSVKILVLLSPQHVHLSLPEVWVLGRVLRHGQSRGLLLGEVGAELVFDNLHLDNLGTSKNGLEGVRSSRNHQRFVVVL